PSSVDEAARVHALEVHDGQLAAIVRSVKLAVISVDEAQTIVLFNPEAEAIFRCGAAQALGAPLDRFIPVAARAVHQRYLANYKGGSGEHGARTMGGDRILHGLRADGEEFPIDASISIAEVDGRKLYTVIMSDVTERVRFQNQLRRYSEIVDSSGDAIVTREISGNILTWNPAAQRLFGYTRAEMMGMAGGSLYSPNMPPEHRDLNQRIMSGESIANFETLRRRKDGSDVQVEVTKSLVRNRHGELIGISSVFRDITERKRMEAELHRLHDEQRHAVVQVRESRDRLRELSSALQTIREEEKTRIARELHDELGQALTALKMDITAIESELDPAHEALRKRTGGMKQLIDATVMSVRRISADLRPVMLDNLGLVSTLEWLTKEFSGRTGIVVDLDISDENLGVGGDAATAIFRIVQEALTNVLRHSGADWVGIGVMRRSGNVVVRVSDNGTGFTDADKHKSRSFGLLGMHERAYVLGGKLTISCPAQGGTQIEATIPAFGTGRGLTS
ncbi:MAG TPA: PAS domain S-box protein, partial [Burkholderiales bacterium]|nr:PAS domain S-box protein [Burkholderiales bacterium]